jgi:prepilin-type N-terminal cleavage/methylation domain-containing protein
MTDESNSDFAAGVIFVGLKNQTGFTLLEIIIAMGLSLALLTTVYGVFRAQSHSVKD